jgi:hypothetical protein
MSFRARLRLSVRGPGLRSAVTIALAAGGCLALTGNAAQSGIPTAASIAMATQSPQPTASLGRAVPPVSPAPSPTAANSTGPGTSASASPPVSAASGAVPGLTGGMRGRAPAPPPPGFVRANGTQLTINDTPWQFVGYNDYRLTSSDPGHQCGGPLSDAEVGAALDGMRTQSGAIVVRTWFMQAYGGPGDWTQFDRVLAAAAARGMRVIPVLSDQWAACEPWPAGQTHYRGLAWYQEGYTQPDYGYSLSYRDYVAAIAAHYSQNPTIAFWQLVNEAEALDSWGGACQGAVANAALRNFADDAAGVIKATDPNHLVSLGTMGGGQCGVSSSEEYANVHAGRIDICEYHDYFGPRAIPGDQWHGIATRINACLALGKPIFAGEIGLQASVAPDGSTGGPVTQASLALRAGYLHDKMTAQLGLGVAGALVWQYAPGPRTDNYEVQPGDPAESAMLQVAATLTRRYITP